MEKPTSPIEALLQEELISTIPVQVIFEPFPPNTVEGQTALIASIPQERIDRYVPQIKHLERQWGALNAEMFSTTLLGSIDPEAEYQKFLKQNPEPDRNQTEAHFAWQQSANQMLEDLRQQHPSEANILPEIFGAAFAPIAEAYKELQGNFEAEGGTNDQFHALRGAVLNRDYSRGGRYSCESVSSLNRHAAALNKTASKALKKGIIIYNSQ